MDVGWAEPGLVAGKRDSTRLGFALQLKFYGLHGRFGDDAAELSDAVVEFVGRQVDVAAAVLDGYDWSNRAARFHRSEIRDYFGFRECSKTDAERAGIWLAVHVCEHAPVLVRGELLAWFRRERIEPPTSGRIDRLVRSALHRGELAVTARIASRLPSDVRAIVSGLDDDRLIDVRDRALLLIGFTTALRRSELTVLTIGDIEPHSEGLIVWKRRSKTDQEGKGQRIEVAYGEHSYTCPVRAYGTWLDNTSIVKGVVFRGVDRHGNISDTAVNDRTIARVVKKHAKRIGLDPDRFARHSFRRGFSTEASRNGASERAISSTTGHTSAKGLKPYIEDAEVFTDPPSRYLGL